ncbi:MAG: glycoside hydrolase family 19 protein [Sphingobacteriales bacterium]|jgi:putative chitinase|nr:glycoside hydrolase family 19 protein [Sphingobacteriales bacterium]
MLLTAQQLKLIAPSLSVAKATELAELINLVAPNYGITNKNLFEEFLATILHESSEFSRKEENLNYTTPERIIKIWPSRFNYTGVGGKKNATAFVRNPKALANEVYNGRMGNKTGSNDGYDFRGGGFIQLTGRDMYNAYARYHGIAASEVADKTRKLDWWALDSACWVFVIEKKLLPLAERNDFITITKRINGGTIGLNDRMAYLARCRKFLV